jgi:hypothetical protein
MKSPPRFSRRIPGMSSLTYRRPAAFAEAAGSIR